MTGASWFAVDSYLADLFTPSDPALEAALAASDAAGLPPHHVSPTEGKLLHLLARLMSARNVLEIGTLAGYSTIWLARALPAHGRLVTLEVDASHAAVARTNIQRAGYDDIVDLRVGRALEALARIATEGLDPFDLVFIDADKPSNPAYLEWSLRLTRPGSLIIADNVVRGGAVIDEASGDPSVLGVRRFMDLLAAEPRVSATAVQTVGAKGHDGLVLALVTA